MKKQLKVFGLLFIVLATYVVSFASAELVDMQTHPSLKQGCDGGTFQTVVYAGTKNHQMTDTFTNTNQSYVWLFNMQGKAASGTYVSLYNVIPNALSMPSMPYLSTGKPHNVSTVVTMGYSEGGASVTSTIPSSYSRNDIAAQVVYHLSRTRMVYRAGGNSPIDYLDYNNLSAKTQHYTYGVQILQGMEVVSDDECMNIHIGFCGDGIVDNGSSSSSTNINTPLKGGEECDDGANNGTSSSNCTSSCKIKPDKASCGSANGGEYESKPTSNLCGDGTASTVTEGTIKYTWTCTKGSAVENCEAKRLQPSCGEANGGTYESKPTSNLCGDGSTASTVTEEDGKYKWSCKRSGLEESCIADKKEPDVASCGSANGKEYESKPTSNLCGDGSTASTVTEGTTKYTWTCKKGNDEKSCEAKRLQPSCGEANGGTYESKPTTKLCGDGSTASTVTEENGKYKWSCKRSGLEESCSADKKEPDKASCGSANGKEYESKPTSNLCGDGSTASTVTEGTTKYTWTCTKGSDEKSCEAKRLQPSCGEANGGTYESKPTTKLCGDGSTASTVTEKDGKYKWSCKRSGLEVSCSADKKEPDKASCGSANGKEYESKPTSNLCGDGSTASTVTEGTTKYTWTCTKGSDEKSCEAKRLQPSCGEANGGTYESKPTTKLCGDGSTASTVTEKDGQYKWSCKRSGLEVSCSADKKEPDVASCGSANGKEYESKPTSNLCGDGSTASTVTEGTTKYTWTCTKGSDEKSCEAKRLQPSCGEANGGTYESKPTTKLCGAGSTASIVKEENGQYKWSCKRSGLEVSCSATKKDEEVPYVTIEEKVLLGEETYNVGDKVSFKVVFKNNTKKNIENALIRDFFPLNLKSSNVSISVEGAKITEYTKEGNNIIEFSGFPLKSGDSGYIILTGEITDDFMSNTENCAFSYKKAGESAVTHACAKPYKIKKNLKIDKNIVSSATKVSNGDKIDYEVKITSYGGIYSGLVIEDDLPDGVSYVSDSYTVQGLSKSAVDFKTGDPLVWNLNIPNFRKGEEIILKYSVRVNQDSEELSYKNKVCALDLSKSELGCTTSTILKDTGGLSVDKFISTSVNGGWKTNLTLNASDEYPIVYFKIDVKGDSGKLQEFVIEDVYDQDTFDFVKQADGIDNYYVDKITNKSDEDYKYVSSMTFENGKIIWTVKMEKGYFTKGNVYSIIFPMKLKALSGGNTACVVNPNSCSNEAKFTIEPDPIPDCIEKGTCPKPECGNGIQDAFEHCDWGGVSQEIGADGKLFKNKGIYNSAYKGLTCSSDCHLNLDPSCFNVQNGSISIMTGEMLPFYWNVEGLLGNQTEEARRNYLQQHFYSSKESGLGGECNEENVYKIDLATLKCNFLIYGPSVGGEKDVVYELNGLDCVGINGWGDGNDNETEYYPAIREYIKQNWSGWFAGSISSFNGADGDKGAKNVFSSLNNWRDFPTLFPVSSKVIINNFGNMGGSFVLGIGQTVNPKHSINTFGEYKISLDNISYSYCDYSRSEEGKNHFFMTNGVNNRVCEVDFALTNHYLAQKSPYGFVDHDTAENLNKYYLKNGEPLFSLEAGDEKVENYQMVSGVSLNFDTFISKYSLAAKGEGQLRQVPGKSIYITDVEPGQKFDLSDRAFLDVLNSGKPFTLIASKGADIVLKGNIVQNMMIITQGKIIFDADGACNAKNEGTTKYSKAGQVVQGIFYAGGGFDSSNDKLNTSVNNNYWCNYGNLHIKGVVLGDLSSVKNKRRSELYAWFHNDSDSKRENVINGASVMIEFNSNLLTSDIPGVSEFNKLLTTQRE